MRVGYGLPAVLARRARGPPGRGAHRAGPGIAYRPESEDAFRARWAPAGRPPPVVERLLALDACFRAGWAGTPTPDLADLLGRAPMAALAAVSDAVRDQEVAQRDGT